MGLKTITPDQLVKLADTFGLPVLAIKAVLHVESSGYGFSPVTGKMIIRFEGSKFREAGGPVIADLHKIQADEYAAYNKAYAIDKVRAMHCTSFGIAQVMGWNYAACGYKSVSAMVEAFDESEYFQISGMLMFIKSQPKMFAALKSLNWAEFAFHYNGPLFKQNNYDSRLAAAFNGRG